MEQAIGMIETYGHTAAVEALDAAFKSSSISSPSMTHIGSGIVTVTFFGDVSAVKTAVDSGTAAAGRVGKVLSSHVIARLDKEVLNSVLGYKDNNVNSNDVAANNKELEDSINNSDNTNLFSNDTNFNSDISNLDNANNISLDDTNIKSDDSNADIDNSNDKKTDSSTVKKKTRRKKKNNNNEQ